MRIAVIGPGAIGLFLASKLSAFAEVSVLGRRETVMAGMQRVSIDGASVAESYLRILSLDTQEARTELAESDVVVASVKAHQLKDLHSTFALLRHQIVVLPQNGLGIIEEAYASGIHSEVRIVRMLCRFGVRKEGPYNLRYAGGRGVTVWSRDKVQAEAWISTLTKAGFEGAHEHSLADAEWSKALINVFVNPICTILNVPNRAVIEDSTLSDLAFGLYQEAYQVARKDGYTQALLDGERLRQVVAPFGNNINSHLEDLRGRRPSDMHFLLGIIIKRAKSLGLRVPRLETIYGLYQALEGRGVDRVP